VPLYGNLFPGLFNVVIPGITSALFAIQSLRPVFFRNFHARCSNKGRELATLSVTGGCLEIAVMRVNIFACEPFRSVSKGGLFLENSRKTLSDDGGRITARCQGPNDDFQP